MVCLAGLRHESERGRPAITNRGVIKRSHTRGLVSTNPNTKPALHGPLSSFWRNSSRAASGMRVDNDRPHVLIA